jgi:hypothetical protein
VLLETLDDIFKDSKEDINSNFTMGDLGRDGSLMEKRKQLGPLTLWDFDRCDSSYDASG